ncbi:MAG: YigZ family protein [Flavobacteriales bacterium]|nr:YigZ family protein [Flavobacteriales bacterium]MCB0808010.1 YigZ family protein [Flavobacteriales bacterium]MCB0818166.1 YigZ family protein [Flavobacteriales bacterium]
MNGPDHYLTLAEESGAQLREKASRFIAYAFPIADEDDFKQRLEALAAKHHDSRHVCYAWVLGAGGERHRANDAGEPNGTAGAPILRHLQGAGLTFAAVVVVRYFGGTKLGRGGLVRAYGDVAREAIAANRTVTGIVQEELRFRCAYDQVERIRQQVLDLGGQVVEQRFGADCDMHVTLPRNAVAGFREQWSVLRYEADGK